MKLEIGGGDRAKGNGFVNIDIIHCADIVHDLNNVPWPIDDNTVEEVYTSHCIEHVKNYFDFLHEITRVCKEGATVQIRCPDGLSEMAMVQGHTHVFPFNVVRHLDHVFPEIFWSGQQKRLYLTSHSYGPDDYWFPKARSCPHFSDWTNEEIIDWVPRTCHERIYNFVVKNNTPPVSQRGLE